MEFQPSARQFPKQYLDFLRELGVKQEEVRLLRYAAKENSAAWEFWSKALHLQGDESVQPARPPASMRPKS